MIGDTNSKFSGNFSTIDSAVLQIETFVGNNILIKRNGSTLRKIRQNQAHISDENSKTIVYYFSIKEKYFGDYTIAVENDERISKNISVFEKKRYKFFVGGSAILRNGVVNPIVTWSNGSSSYRTGDTFVDGVIRVTANSSVAMGSIFTPSFDLTEYSTLVFHVKQTYIHQNQDRFAIRVGLKRTSNYVSTTAGNKNDFAYYTELTTTSNEFVNLSVDITSATTGLFIATAGNFTCEIDEIYLA